MTDLINLLTSKEIIIVYIVAGVDKKQVLSDKIR